MNNHFSTKAETLSYLKNVLKRSVIDDLFAFTLTEWQLSPEGILKSIQTAFPNQLVIARSSTLDEDSIQGLRAGYFHSQPNISTSDPKELADGITRVLRSYSRNGRVPNPQDQVLVQPHIQQVKFSGVVLTRDLRLNAPYYVINYDCSSRLPSAVTKGLPSSLMRLARWRDALTLEHPWDELVLAIQELEQIFHGRTLDIEFAIDAKDAIHIFQVRPLLQDDSNLNNEEIKAVVDRLRNEFGNITSESCGLAGGRTIFCDMSDWNPAEIIGNRSNVLDYTLYRFVITESIWNRARVSLGYVDVAPFELMVSFANKPYVDARVSFNSLTPKSLNLELRKKLVDYYIRKLACNPDLQDKVEFDVVFNCFDLSFNRRTPELRSEGFSEEEIDSLHDNLLTFTNRLLKMSDYTISDSVKTLEQLEGRRSQIEESMFPDSPPQQLLDKAFDLLVDCQELGALPFSKLARLAFVGIIILKSMLHEGIIDKSLFYNLMSSIKTVATRFRTDLYRLAQGTLSLESFMKLYGHLRPGTYDITAPRYDHTPKLFKKLRISPLRSVMEPEHVFDQTTLDKIDNALAGHGIQYSAEDFLNFVKKTIQFREYSKFQFTKNVSEAIEFIALAGSRMGLTRKELAMIDLDTLMHYRGCDRFDPRLVRRTWKKVTRENQTKKTVYQKIALPPVITSGEDFTLIQYYEPRPNFVTTKSVDGNALDLSAIGFGEIPDASDKIIILENADPGYDWIFMHDFKGLITIYGGVASHMAIRCAEFGLPAAIGCGQVAFERIRTARRIRMDCAMERIVPLY